MLSEANSILTWGKRVRRLGAAGPAAEAMRYWIGRLIRTCKIPTSVVSEGEFEAVWPA